ncbi:MAG: beta-ketoacyl synthase N-terminal-like domain-containing protein [Planctomycetota bacterium]
MSWRSLKRSMVGLDDIVITGVGCVSSIGIGRAALQSALLQGESGIRPHLSLNDDVKTTYLSAPVLDFDGKKFVTPRKAIKVMSREVQMAYSAARLAWEDAGIENGMVAPERMGVIYGSEIIPGDHAELAGAVKASRYNDRFQASRWGEVFGKEVFPLWMLRNLPNMPACHVGIAIDARGPNNTIAQEEVSGLLALSESIAIIERGAADMMVVGGVGNRVTPPRMSFRVQRLYHQQPEDEVSDQGCPPFSSQSRGIVGAEGSAAIVIERRSHAVKRGATVLGTVLACTSRCGTPSKSYAGSKEAIASAAAAVLSQAAVDVSDLNHVCSQGFAEANLDQTEAMAIADVVGDQVPITAVSSYLGTAGAACGMMELVGSLLTLNAGRSLPIHGWREPPQGYAVQVLKDSAQASTASCFLKTSQTPFGHAAAAVVRVG